MTAKEIPNIEKKAIKKEYIEDRVYAKLEVSEVGKNIYGKERDHNISVDPEQILTPEEIQECNREAEEVCVRALDFYHDLKFQSNGNPNAAMVQPVYYLAEKIIEEDMSSLSPSSSTFLNFLIGR